MQEIVEIGRATQDELRDDLRELFQGAIRPDARDGAGRGAEGHGRCTPLRAGGKPGRTIGTAHYLRRLLTSLGQIEVAMPRSPGQRFAGRRDRPLPAQEPRARRDDGRGVCERRVTAQDGRRHRGADGRACWALDGESCGKTARPRPWKGWRRAPIEGPHPYLYLDATFLDARWARKVENVSALVAYAVGPEGHRRLLAVTLGAEEVAAELVGAPRATPGPRPRRCRARDRR